MAYAWRSVSEEVIIRTMETIGNILFVVGEWMLNNISVEGLIALPALMVGFLVAIAIFNFEDSKRGLQIDVPTVISQVVKVNNVLVAIFLSSLIVIFWPNNSSTNTVFVIPLLIIPYVAGLILLTQSLRRAFKWARSIETGKNDNFRATSRRHYLERLNDNEKRDAWEKIWQADDGVRKLIDERQLVKLFVTSVKNIKDKGQFAPWLVQDLISTIDTIHLDDPVIMQELVNFCMGDSYGFTEDDNIEDRKKAGELRYSMNLRRLYFAILKQSMRRNDNSFFTLINASRAYLRENGLDEAKFVKSFASNFFEQIGNNANEHWIWETLPDEWKISLANLTSDEHGKVALAWLNAYGRWMSGKQLFSDKGTYNLTLDEATREMFPTADPITWARLYGFHWSSHGVDDGESSEHAQVRNYIENHITFGLMGHVMTYFDGDEDQAHKQMANAHEEALEIAARTTIFPSFFNPETMKKYFQAISELRVHNGADEDKARKLDWLETTLKDIQKRIKDNITKNPLPLVSPVEKTSVQKPPRRLARLLNALFKAP